MKDLSDDLEAWFLEEVRAIDQMPLNAHKRHALRVAALFEAHRRAGNTYEDIKAATLEKPDHEMTLGEVNG